LIGLRNLHDRRQGIVVADAVGNFRGSQHQALKYCGSHGVGINAQVSVQKHRVGTVRRGSVGLGDQIESHVGDGQSIESVGRQGLEVFLFQRVECIQRCDNRRFISGTSAEVDDLRKFRSKHVTRRLLGTRTLNDQIEQVIGGVEVTDSRKSQRQVQSSPLKRWAGERCG
jgi:hypothetical protein